MKHYEIKNFKTGDTLYEGKYESMRHCIESAIHHQVSLGGADLSFKNLTNANLDGADLRQARFTESNLVGANLSEAFLDGADFTNASLQNVCLCFSSLKGCNFSGALFGATDIAGCDISRSRFDTLSCFSLNFTDCENMAGCIFDSPESGSFALSRPPITISGLPKPVVFFDRHLMVGRVTKRIHDNVPSSPMKLLPYLSPLLELAEQTA